MTAPRLLLPPQDWPEWPRSIRDLEDPHALPPEAWDHMPDHIAETYTGNFYDHYSPPRAEGLAYIADRRAAGLMIDQKFIVLMYSGSDYRIARGRIRTEADLLRVVHELTSKSWIDLARLRHFIERVSCEVLGKELP